MSYSILPVEVQAVLADVSARTAEYERPIGAFEGSFQALLAAAKNPEALSAAVGGFASNVLTPALETITGRTGTALEAVGNVLSIVATADAQMADDARQAQIQAAQSTAGGSYDTALHTGPRHGPVALA